MVKIYTLFSLAMEDVRFTEGKIYFYPSLNGTLEAMQGASSLLPILFVSKDM